MTTTWRVRYNPAFLSQPTSSITVTSGDRAYNVTDVRESGGMVRQNDVSGPVAGRRRWLDIEAVINATT